jgi:hypothetical protein
MYLKRGSSSNDLVRQTRLVFTVHDLYIDAMQQSAFIDASIKERGRTDLVVCLSLIWFVVEQTHSVDRVRMCIKTLKRKKEWYRRYREEATVYKDIYYRLLLGKLYGDGHVTSLNQLLDVSKNTIWGWVPWVIPNCIQTVSRLVRRGTKQ